MTGRSDSWLALDIGGANVKAAHSQGVVRTLAFPLWRDPGGLPRVIARVAESLPEFDRVALTMTAELCDHFVTKREGVRAVVDAVVAALPGRPLSVWGLDGQFHDAATARSDPLRFAAANWLALATHAARRAGTGAGLLIDIGSTTTDLIPFHDGKVLARGRTDTERLQSGELVYAGVKRTPVCALADQLPHRGRPTRLAAELFATTWDVFLTLGAMAEDPEDLSTADGRAATREHSRDRLARMVGADREGFDQADAEELSTAARDVLLARLFAAARGLHRETRPDHAVVAGSGEFLARALAEQLMGQGGQILSMTDVWGADASVAGCARALLELVA